MEKMNIMTAIDVETTKNTVDLPSLPPITMKTTLGELLAMLDLGEKPPVPTSKELYETAGEPIAEMRGCTLFRNGYGGSVGIWQYSDKGRVNGINGNVDLDEAIIDYTGKVMANGLNGFNAVNAAETVAAPAPIEVPFPAGVNDSVAVVIQVGDDIYKGTLTKV